MAGIEDLSFEFPEEPYNGHVNEFGYNAMAFSGVRNCRARDLWIHNSHSSILVQGANVTMSDIEFDSDRPPERSCKATGHLGFNLSDQDNLLTGFEVRTHFMQNITVTHGSADNVPADQSGVDQGFDHHRYASHTNLLTDIDLGNRTRVFQSGGGLALGGHSGA